ncbi:glycoside hydrolase family 97 protein [Stakelama marina]|uniref:Glycoside hydrolase family 97 protein n=1 Tax=Stakelama marina TaxID=2826939 RepID=A0A8T4ILF5_9SPHN|nr:glycoside hydrolase family 97 protein [Stakelama marina]MBR0553955.1 glycoside hydrolase family 97 protein [Stakelama marina]
MTLSRTFTRTAALLALGAAAIGSAQAKDIASVTSPDGHIKVTVAIGDEARLTYSVSRDGTPLITPSRIGFTFTDMDPMERGFQFDGASTSSSDTRWEQPWGERRYVTDNHNELVVKVHQNGSSDAFKEAPAERRITLRFRVFDNGVGFRTEFGARPGGGAWHIADEDSEFNIAEPGTAWWIQAGDWNRYEYLYHKTPIDAVSVAHTPMTMKLQDGTWLSFHEASLVDYSGMWLKRLEGGRFRSTLAPSSHGAKVIRTGPFTTPWRTIRIASDAPGLYDNDLELNLNEPNKLGDVSWVKPFKYVGIWWKMHLDEWSWNSGPKHGATTEHAKQYIDFAAKHGFNEVLVEGWNVGWDVPWGRGFDFTKPYPDFDLKAVTDYARKKGVKFLGHNETGGNIANYEAQLDDAMSLYQSLGMNAVKTGYVADAGGITAPGDTPGTERMEWHDGQRTVEHHMKVVKDAAQHHIMIDDHEPVKDTGLRRTYPNWVSREGARGMEYNAWGVPKNPPSHIPNVYFTRMLSGPFDYTPGVLSLVGRGNTPIESTIARQLALYVVIYSPIQMAADTPENYAKHPNELTFIEKVPTDWAQTHTLMGEPGAYVVTARKDRNSDDWYVGGVTNEKARDVTVDLSFLDPGKTYTAKIWRDAPDADYRTETRFHDVIETRKVKKGDTWPVHIAPGGGFAIRIAAE